MSAAGDYNRCLAECSLLPENRQEADGIFKFPGRKYLNMASGNSSRLVLFLRLAFQIRKCFLFHIDTVLICCACIIPSSLSQLQYQFD